MNNNSPYRWSLASLTLNGVGGGGSGGAMVLGKLPVPGRPGGGRVVRWCWVNFQCRGVLQFGLQ